MMMIQYFAENPKVPYEHKLSNRLVDGSQVIVKGIVTPKPKRFHVNFCCGSGCNADIALHCKAQFSDRTVVLNTYRYKKWETEEISHSFPLEDQRQFEINLTARDYYFEIVVNGCSLNKFIYRMPLEKITTVQVDGDLILSKVLMLGRKLDVKQQLPDSGFNSAACCSGGSWGSPPPYPGPPVQYPIIYNPIMPVIVPIDAGMHPGKNIFISGRPASRPERFSINLKHGSLTTTKSDIAFHFDPRFHYGATVREIVCNSKIKGHWGTEETLMEFPFAPGLDFNLIIKCHSDCFLVIVNGVFLKSYKHRLYPVSNIRALEITGDVFITMITFQNE